jgi:glutamate/tyrosine decarboxylase-like PLP-dependent enzyme
VNHLPPSEIRTISRLVVMLASMAGSSTAIFVAIRAARRGRSEEEARRARRRKRAGTLYFGQSTHPSPDARTVMSDNKTPQG